MEHTSTSALFDASSDTDPASNMSSTPRANTSTNQDSPDSKRSQPIDPNIIDSDKSQPLILMFSFSAHPSQCQTKQKLWLNRQKQQIVSRRPKFSKNLKQ
jgi:hypothetical protein